MAASISKSRDVNSRVDQGKMKSLYAKNIEYNIRPLVFKKSVTNEHCFVIQEIDDDLKKELLFALSFHSVILRAASIAPYCRSSLSRMITEWKDRAKSSSFLRSSSISWITKQCSLVTLCLNSSPRTLYSMFFL